MRRPRVRSTRGRKKEPHEPCERPRVPNLIERRHSLFCANDPSGVRQPRKFRSAGRLMNRKGAVYERTWAWALRPRRRLRCRPPLEFRRTLPWVTARVPVRTEACAVSLPPSRYPQTRHRLPGSPGGRSATLFPRSRERFSPSQPGNQIDDE